MFKERPCWIVVQDLQKNASDSACCPVLTKINFFGPWSSLSWPSCSGFEDYYFPKYSGLFGELKINHIRFTEVLLLSLLNRNQHYLTITLLLGLNAILIQIFYSLSVKIWRVWRLVSSLFCLFVSLIFLLYFLTAVEIFNGKTDFHSILKIQNKILFQDL